LRAAVYYSNDDLRIEERPRPASLGESDAVLRIEASGVCGSDLMEWYRKPKAPLVLGHEVAGVLVRVGAGVERFRPGDRVVATHHVPCETCRYCRTDRHAACPTLRQTRFEPGGFCEETRLGPLHLAHGTLSLPERVSFAEGTFVEPLACTVRGQRLAGGVGGRTVTVIGSGVAGILHVQLARAHGAARVLAADVRDARCAAALRFGADDALRADRPDAARRLLEAGGGRGADRVFVCAGARPAFDLALAVVDLGGTIQPFAPLPPGETWPVEVLDLWTRGVSIVPSYAGPPADMRAALDLIATGRVDVLGMVTHRFPLAETGLAFATMADGGCLKAIVEPQR
jgi:L-iditol 2-dehydrogenase